MVATAQEFRDGGHDNINIDHSEVGQALTILPKAPANVDEGFVVFSNSGAELLDAITLKALFGLLSSPTAMAMGLKLEGKLSLKMESPPVFEANTGFQLLPAIYINTQVNAEFMVGLEPSGFWAEVSGDFDWNDSDGAKIASLTIPKVMVSIIPEDLEKLPDVVQRAIEKEAYAIFAPAFRDPVKLLAALADAPKSAWDAMATWGRDAWNTVAGWGDAAWYAVSKWTPGTWNTVADWTASKWQAVGKWTEATWAKAKDWGADTWRGFVGLGEEAWTTAANFGEEAMGAIGGWTTETWSKITSGELVPPWLKIGSVGADAADQVQDLMQSGFLKVFTAWSDVKTWETMADDWGPDVWDKTKDLSEDAWNELGQRTADEWGKIAAGIEEVGEEFTEGAEEVGEDIAEGAEDVGEGVVEVGQDTLNFLGGIFNPA